MTLLSIFIMGLLSGVHCVGMCGGIASALSLGSQSKSGTQKRLWIQAQQQIKADAVSFPLFTRAYAMAKAKYFDLGFEQESFSFYRITESARILKH